MEQINLNRVMDEFYEIVNNTPVEDAVTRLMRCAGTYGNAPALEALTRLLVMETARRRHAEARMAARMPPPERAGDL